MNKKKEKMANLEVLLLTMIWGGSFVASKLAQTAYDSFFILAIRYLGGALLIFAFFEPKMHRLTMQTIRYGSIVGVITYLGMSLQMYALKATTAASQSFLLVSYTVFVPILEWIITKKSPGRQVFLASLCIMCGVWLIAVKGDFSLGYGEMLTVIFAVLYSVQIILIGIYMKRIEPFSFTFVMLLTTGICAVITCVVLQVPFVGYTDVKSFGALFYLTVFNTAIAFALQNHAQKYMSSTATVLIMSLESVFGAIVAAVILREIFSIKMLFGSALILLANIIVKKDEIKKLLHKQVEI